MLTIDKGSNDGLKPDMAVITPDGIVGKLRDVFPTTAQVLEINDQTSGAGVILASTRIRAILRGTVAGRAQIGNLTADSRIKPGEQVLTSGGDQVYPRGLPVGTIQSIAPDPDHQPYTAIVVRPAADLNRVEEVLVITGTQSEPARRTPSRTSPPPRRSTPPTSAPSGSPASTTTSPRAAPLELRPAAAAQLQPASRRALPLPHPLPAAASRPLHRRVHSSRRRPDARSAQFEPAAATPSGPQPAPANPPPNSRAAKLMHPQPDSADSATKASLRSQFTLACGRRGARL